MHGILAKLSDLKIDHETVGHAAGVMTSEDQKQALAGAPGGVTKNLFLKDKKGHLYIITALHSTTIELKTLSSRLGLGKGGLRLAPDDLIQPILGVPLGSVTPLALSQPGTEGVVLLLDQGLRAQDRLWVHPLTNTASTALAPAGLEAFLASLGREAVYVDLEAAPQIDREHPPDLKHIADAAVPMVSAGDDAAQGGGAAPAPAAAPAAKDGKKKKGGKAAPEPAAGAAAAQPRRHDVNAATDLVIKMATERLAGAESAGAADPDVLRRLTADVAMELNALRNAAYAAGFKAAQGAMAASLALHRA